MKGEQPDQQDQSILRNLEEPDRGECPRGCEVGRVGKIGLPAIDEFERGQFRRSAGLCLDPVERFGLQAVGIADLAKAKRSEERRVGTEWVSTCRGRLVPV